MSYFADEMTGTIEAEQRITHEKMAERVEQQLDASKLWKSFDAGPNVRDLLSLVFDESHSGLSRTAQTGKGTFGMGLYAHRSVGRGLRPQILRPVRRIPSPRRRHSLLPGNPVQILLL